MTKRTTRKKSMFVADIVKDNKEVEKTSYEAENHSNEFSEDMTVSTETSQLSQIEVEEVTVHTVNSTLYRTKPNPIREYYQKVLMNERFYHGYLPLKDATEILKYQPSGHFIVHVTNECGFLSPVVVSVKHYADVIHHTLEVGVTGKCYTTKRMFETISHIIEHHVQTGQFINESINFRLIAPANFCDWQIKTENVMIMKNVIGTGCFSNVSFALYIDNGKCIEAAAKCPKEVAEVDTVGMMYTEHRLLQQLDCPYIIKPFGVTVFTEIPMMVMEYANGGSLLNYLNDYSIKIKRKFKFCLQIASALEYLKRKNLIHRDIAARNCLVFKSANKVIAKLSDFNLCKEITEEEEDMPYISLRWSAPESLRQCLWSFESDLWMFGVLIWEIFTNALNPHDKANYENTAEFCSYLMEGNTLEMLPEIPLAIQTIILRLNSINPAERGELETVVQELTALLIARKKKVHSFSKPALLDDGCPRLLCLSTMKDQKKKPVAQVNPMPQLQPCETKVEDAMRRNECSVLTARKLKANNPMREFFRKKLYNESYFHGYLTEKDAYNILKNKPHGYFLVHLTNEHGILKPLVLSVKFDGEVVHHQLNVSILGKCFVKTKVFNSVSEMIAHHMESGDFIEDRIKFQLITAANFSDWQIKTDNVMIIDHDIAQGSFSTVSYGFHIHNNKYNDAAIKCPTDVPWADTIEMMYTEHRLLQQLDCPYIIKAVGMTVFAEIPMMVMEYANAGSLDNCLKKLTFQNKCKIEFCLQIASALKYLKTKKLIHRDIAARNCLLFKDAEKATAKLSDFNLCKEESEEEKGFPNIPLRWSAPESLIASSFSYNSDLWMLGVLIWEIFTNALNPHDKTNIEDSAEFCSYLLEENTLEMLPEIPNGIQTIILRLNSITPAKRGEVETVVEELSALLSEC
ncbi:Tyrosine-protein kinase Fer [Trichinella britovi]|uniref:Tyrosine-protein kinase n=1 Tax=Trichinella britovi TaxID=45882 RepID=A0A0V1D9Q9_TRIBR|nr:Tyrosine-protein kinase Fer [Trichinella britovi]